MLIKIESDLWNRIFGGHLWKSYDELVISELKDSPELLFIQIG